MRPVEASDLPEVQRWLSAWRVEVPLDLLPPVGFIVPGVAAGWVYLAGPLAVLEPLVANPDAPREERSAALDAVTVELVRVARERGARIVWALTMNQAVGARAQRHGFEDAGRFRLWTRDVR